MMQRYEKYKDSGVDWIGEIPEHWKVVKLKYIFKILKRIAGSEGFDVLSITQRGIKVKDVTSGEGQLAMDYAKYQFCYVNDFAMNHMDLLTGWVDISNFDGVISPDYRVFNLIRNDCSKPYLLTLLQLCYTNKVFYAHGQGVSMLGRWRFPSENFNNFYFPIPRIDEQFKIVSFLDDKTAKIGQTIANKQKEIELLKERRQVFIQKAVTKGLDDTVKLKDSGVDWIGEIPEHWEVRKLKYIGNLFSGLTNKKGDDFSKEPKEGFSPFIPFTNIFRNNKISEKEFQFVKSSPYDIQNVVEFNDILFLMSSETFDDIGKNSIYLGKTKVFLNSFCKGFKIYDKNINPLFINYMLLSKNYREYFASVGRGFTRINIKQEYVLDMPILYIPLEEQDQITTHLEEVEEKIAKAITLKEQEIEKLKEYKTVLIDQVVTGKVKVS